MSVSPVATGIPRRGRGTEPAEGVGPVPVADWDEVAAVLRAGEVGPFWLSVVRDDGIPHVRPIFAAWAGSSFFFASKESAAKTRHLERQPQASVSVGLESLHLVVEGRVSRVTGADGLGAVSQAMQDVFGWPTRVEGDVLDADYGAPTSGGPPYQAFELVPAHAYGFPTQDQVQPTHWTFEPSS